MTTLLSLVSQPWAQTLGWTLLHFLWQGAALGLAQKKTKSSSAT